MARFIADDIDFAAYERGTDCQVKVRPAAAFRDDVQASFQTRDTTRGPRMGSTKLRDAIEFRPGEVTCWAGYSGHRKSMFLGQVALDLCDVRQRSLIVSLEMPPRATLSRMARQAIGSERPSTEDVDGFMTWTDGALWLFDHEGRLLPDRCIAVCRYFATELRGQHVFIDSLMKVVQSEESLDEAKRMVGDLCDVAKETGLHVHLVAHARKPSSSADGEGKPPTKYDIRGSAAVSDQCHNIVMVWQNKARRAAAASAASPKPDATAIPWDAVISIEKQRNGDTEGKFGLMFHAPSLRFIDSEHWDVDPYRMTGGMA